MMKKLFLYKCASADINYKVKISTLVVRFMYLLFPYHGINLLFLRTAILSNVTECLTIIMVRNL